ANVYGGIKYLLDVADINEGQLSFTYITKPVPTGEYVIEVLARDSYGNEQRFEAASYALTNQLNVIAQIPRTEYLPGEAIKVTGELKNVEGEMVTAATAYVSFEGTESAAKIKNGRFEYEFKLADAIKSGRHSVTVSASDELGNSGAVSVLFSVTPVATRLELEMPKTSASPLESIDLTPKLFDQANDVMGVLVNIEMKDANGDAAVSNQYESGKKLRYNVGQYAVPGDWKVKASYGRLKSESAFTVAEVKELQIGISGAVLTFTNTGNARWRDDIAVSIDSAEQHFKDAMRDSIKPGASGQLDLGETAPSGTYTVSVALPDRTETFENVAVANGKKVYNLDFVYAVMLLVVVGLIAYELTVLLHKSRHNKYRIGNDDLHRLARHAQKKWDEKSYEATEKAKMIEDYKRMTLEEIKRTEEKMNPPYPADKPWRRRVERKPSSPQKKDEGKGGDMSGAAGFFGAF
ncbi:MAG TPA: hypothetical protein HA362_07195, partial [Nanoarchaeota archaeon]|nr:hypothetical protein [Nanoarchaeota archaeon]